MTDTKGSRKYNFRFQSYPNTIEQERARHGWTQGTLAERAGVSRGSIGRLEMRAGGGIPSKKRSESITDTTAQLIADALGVTPEALFEHYAEAAAKYKPRVKPFATREERDAAIIAALEPVKYTALKMSGVLRCKDVWYEMDDIISEAYAELVAVAEEAFTRGISGAVCFDAYACGAVKKRMLRIQKYHGQQCRKAELVSYEAYFPLYDPASSFNLEERVCLREECREAVKTLTPERRRDPYIAEMLEAVGI
mgnify:CR=1 FL=1|jgi:transcriptional regulator with XRE-family HTH domain